MSRGGGRIAMESVFRWGISTFNYRHVRRWFFVPMRVAKYCFLVAHFLFSLEGACTDRVPVFTLYYEVFCWMLPGDV